MSSTIRSSEASETRPRFSTTPSTEAFVKIAGVALLLAIGLTACTAGFFYNRLDWFIAWYVNGLVSLDSAQEERLRTSLRRELEWHRRSQIPKYITLLEDIEADLQNPATVARIEQRYRQMTDLLDETVDHLLPDAADLLYTLGADQITQLSRNMEEDNVDLRKEYSGATPVIRAKRLRKNTRRFLERLVGKLSTEQLNLMDSRLRGMHDNSEAWLERRRQWQTRFIALLRAHPPRADFGAALRDMALNPNQFDSPGYRRSVLENRAIIFTLLADIENGLSAHQKKHLAKKLEHYVSDLREISERG